MSLRPLFNMATIQKFMDQFVDEKEQKMIELLSYAGNQGVRHARLNGNYRDRTGNLRSSIGFMVVKDGKAVDEYFEEADKGSDKSTGVSEAKKLALRVAKTHNKGLVLILVAGMNYAVHVESLENYDVLQSAVYATESLLKETMEEVLYGRS